MNHNFLLLGNSRLNNQVSQIFIQNNSQIQNNLEINSRNDNTQVIAQTQVMDHNILNNYYNFEQNNYMTQQIISNPLSQDELRNYIANYENKINILKEIFIKKNRNLKNEYDIVNMPVLKLSQYIINHLNYENEILKTFYISPYGMKDSERFDMDNFIKIGRLLKDDHGNFINDIALGDNYVSRFHCKISIEDGFKKVEKIPEEWLSFLMINHPRLSTDSNFQNLNTELIFNIFSYLTKKRQFYIIDSGSSMGTYVKLKHSNPHELKKNEFFQIGCDFTIFITDFSNNSLNERNEYSLKKYLSEIELKTSLRTDRELLEKLTILDLNYSVSRKDDSGPYLKILIQNIHSDDVQEN